MTKVKLIFILMVLCSQTFGRDANSVVLNFGSTSFSGVMNKSAEMAVNCALSINRIQLDFSSNLINANRALDLSVINLGYILKINALCSFAPMIGIGYSNGNYEGSYNCDIIHNSNNTYYANIGFICNLRLGKNIGLYTGMGTFESFRMGIIFALSH